MENKLYEFFDVNSKEELDEFIKNNPEDRRVQELQEFLDFLDEDDLEE